MNRLSNWQFKQVDIAGAMVAIVATGLFYWASIQPAIASHDLLRVDTAKLEQSRQEAAARASKVDEIRKSLAQSRDAFNSINLRLDPASSTNDRLSRLNAMAADCGLKIDEIRPAEPSYGKDFGHVAISLNGSGGFHAWSAFLHEVSQKLSDTAVDSFALSGREDAQGGTGQFHIDLVWYVAP